MSAWRWRPPNDRSCVGSCWWFFTRSPLYACFLCFRRLPGWTLGAPWQEFFSFGGVKQSGLTCILLAGLSAVGSLEGPLNAGQEYQDGLFCTPAVVMVVHVSFLLFSWSSSDSPFLSLRVSRRDSFAFRPPVPAVFYALRFLAHHGGGPTEGGFPFSAAKVLTPVCDLHERSPLGQVAYAFPRRTFDSALPFFPWRF